MREFRVDDLKSVNMQSDEIANDFSLNSDVYVLLSEQHSTDWARSYYVFFDGSAVWADVPGGPSLVAVHIRRDVSTGTFTAERADEAIMPFAHGWLTERGADPDGFIARTDQRPANEETRRLANELRWSAARLRVVDSYTHDSEPATTWVIAEDLRPSDSTAPVRLIVDRADLTDDTYTLTQEFCPNVESARARTRDL
ncbi:hypothetical protein [Streptomyces boninensis]|uniref:hypothetical protein n=1 Tax=Streptomyces boninensis TaxID=2039455 RepID=UPI003B20BF6A